MGVQAKENNKMANTDVKQVKFKFTSPANGRTLAPILQLHFIS